MLAHESCLAREDFARFAFIGISILEPGIERHLPSPARRIG